MKNTALWSEQGYCSSHIKDAHLQTKSLALEIPINDTISEYDICRFKLIFEEVKNEKQLLMDSAILGEKITEIMYKNVSFVEQDFICYTHENNLDLLKSGESGTIQQALSNGVLLKKILIERIT